MIELTLGYLIGCFGMVILCFLAIVLFVTRASPNQNDVPADPELPAEEPHDVPSWPSTGGSHP